MALTKTEKFSPVQRRVQRRQSRRLILRLLRALAVALLLEQPAELVKPSQTP